MITLYDLMNSNNKSIKFDDIVEFCKSGETEGIQLEYKEKITPVLKKEFASFSNKRGGVIIIGVKDNKSSGIPELCEGVDIDAQDIERINQFAINIDPIPSYEILSIENDEKSKRFILIRIAEGDSTPYFVKNEGNIYVRVGNITATYERFDVATPDEIRAIFDKRNKAEKQREINIELKTSIFKAGFDNAQNEYLSQDQNTTGRASSLSEVVGLSEFLIQPYFPSVELAPVSSLKAIILDGVRDRHGNSFPEVSTTYRPILNGITSFQFHKHNNSVESIILLSNGLFSSTVDALNIDKEGNKIAHIFRICLNTIMGLRYAKILYGKMNYSGLLKGFVSADGFRGVRLKGVNLNWMYEDDTHSLLNQYKYTFQVDTYLLNNNELLRKFEIQVVKDLHWYLGVDITMSDKIAEEYIEKYV